MAKARKKVAKKKSAATKKRPATKKKSASRKRAKGKSDGRLPLAPAAVGGPVTLTQAKALVLAQSPQHAPLQAAAVATTSPAALGAERKRLDAARRAEIERRIREYEETLTIMKQRGVKGLAPKLPKGPKGAAPAAAVTAAPQPLQIMAEGDSWFDYPVPFFGGGIIPRLESRLGVPILNLAKAGDEVRFMLGVEERALLTEQFSNGCPAGGPWDVLLFSGGGNDIVGNPMALWIRDYVASVPPSQLLHQVRLDAALAIVRAGYEDLIGMRDTLSPSTQLVFHAYDFAIPDGRGVCFQGPWMKPTFDLRQFPTLAAATGVVKVMLQQFAAMLTSLANTHNGVTFINGQGTLTPAPSSWHNELHPAKVGFNKFAEVFHQKLKALFPSRVL